MEARSLLSLTVSQVHIVFVFEPDAELEALSDKLDKHSELLVLTLLHL